MTRLVVSVARPVTLWALHFIAVYALISAACGPRALFSPEILRATVSLVTLVTAAIMLGFLILSLRQRRGLQPDMPEAVLAQAAVWSAGISLLAILGNLWPVATLATCSG